MDKLSELKAAALAATPGPWLRSSVQFNGITTEATFITQGNKPHVASTSEKRDAIFIAAANPDVVLALLAELEAKDKLIITVTEEREFWRERVEGAEKEREELRRRFNLERSYTEDADKRIAELESSTFTAAAADVLAERQRQVTAEGWTAERDDGYQNSELADAAACYAIHAHNQGFSTPAHWPWSPDWWKQTSPRRDLVKAGALILAEIERIDRAAGFTVEGDKQ